MFIDEATIVVEGGDGGNGVIAFFPGMKTGPSGGDGGRGGDVYVKGDRSKVDLYQYVSKKKYKGNKGSHGENFNRSGAAGEDTVLTVPIGTLFTSKETTESFEITNEDDLFVLARGGKGGRGNAAFTSSTHQSPRKAENGQKGEQVEYKVILRLIADFGLIGLPNAGKSSILNELTAAQAKIGAYPFTTLEPNLGVYKNLIIADIPGLIEGASHGKGLGYKFLKHIEKVKVLLHCIAADSTDIDADYHTVWNEMKNYNEKLLNKLHIILLTKSDLVSSAELAKKKEQLSKYVEKTIPVSIYNPQQFEELQKLLSSFQ